MFALPGARPGLLLGMRFAVIAARLSLVVEQVYARTVSDTGIHSQCMGLQPGGEANLMLATRSVADSSPAEPDVTGEWSFAKGVYRSRARALRQLDHRSNVPW
ncbi:hypothetical protein ACFQ7F_29425 [Streptomyces sp. NPDC056486]|uniref:hypothetical protein n=1 Tax=Streptomyces sp. NPDC056486 TaxID=3345835 RepID=UPI00367AAE63